MGAFASSLTSHYDCYSLPGSMLFHLQMLSALLGARVAEGGYQQLAPRGLAPVPRATGS